MLLLAFTIAGCTPKAVRQARLLEGQYVVGNPGEGWKKVAAGGADFAFRNRSDAAVIYADSNCGARFEDAPLEDLATHMTFGVSTGEPSFEETYELDGRTAYTSRALGELDGVPVELGTTVLKKDRCTYDIVVIAPRGERFQSAWEGYQAVLAGFATR
ncbi:MAG TPA: hypothetical protein QGF58_06470 [Myxococcota bacterium]|nr:hypothetical protein [Myxococcota bacterium]